MIKTSACTCSISTRVLGDGCEACNPALALEYAKGQIESQREEIERLRAWIEPEANCPCCDQSVNCNRDCTFSEDRPNAAKKMMMAREALGS